MAMLYLPDGTQKEVHPKDAKSFTLEELQAFVEGYIEQVRLSGGRDMWVNEDGKRMNMEYNAEATKLVSEWYVDRIVGPALVTRTEHAGQDDERIY